MSSGAKFLLQAPSVGRMLVVRVAAIASACAAPSAPAPPTIPRDFEAAIGG